MYSLLKAKQPSTSSKEQTTMRGDNLDQAGVFSYISPEQRVPQDHPLRAIQEMVNQILVELSPAFDRLYARTGRPSTTCCFAGSWG